MDSMNNERKIAPSILSADFSQMGEGIKAIETAQAHWVHIDVMDGQFVPPITFGHKMVEDIRPLTKLTLDVHLMVNNPERQIESFAKAGADYLTVHLESSVHIHRTLGRIRELGCRPGISIVPSTPVSLLKEVLSLVDLVLIMTVNPGYGGQSMIPSCLDKVTELKEIRAKQGYDWLISIDGGVNHETLPLVEKVNPEVLVAGSAFYKAEDKADFVRKFK